MQLPAGRKALSFCCEATHASDECMLQDGREFCILQPQAVSSYHRSRQTWHRLLIGDCWMQQHASSLKTGYAAGVRGVRRALGQNPDAAVEWNGRSAGGMSRLMVLHS